MKEKAQIHENTQFLYHEDLQLSQNLGQNISDPEHSLSESPNTSLVNSGPNSGILYQSDAPSDLRVVSWAPGVPFGNTKFYAYDPESGGESIIYIIENGIDGRNRVDIKMPAQMLVTLVNAVRNSSGHHKTGCTPPA